MAPTATTTSTTTAPATASTHSVVKVMAADTSNTVDSLRSLYNRAARAFLHRNVPLTHSLLESAFTMLVAPSFNPADTLNSARKRWDILRITFETTVYSDPPPDLPELLRQRTLSETPQSLIKSIHSRSLNLFTPACGSGSKLDAAYLPPQVLTTLALSSLKLDCADVGREIIEEWLARRGAVASVSWEAEGYEKVIETYCLRTLPRLDLWDYSKEFLDYESEMSPQTRQGLQEALNALCDKALSESILRSVPSQTDDLPLISSSSTPSPRPTSPSLSTSSSLSTTSTQTAIPGTPRANRRLKSLTPGSGTIATLSSASTDSGSSSSTMRPKARSLKRTSNVTAARHIPDNVASPSAIIHRANGSATAAYSLASHSRSPDHRYMPRPDTMTLVRTSIGTIGRYMARTKLLSMLIIFVMFLVFRLRGERARRRLSTTGTADLVRGRLKNADVGGVLGRMWAEVVHAITDTIRMGGSGLGAEDITRNMSKRTSSSQSLEEQKEFTFFASTITSGTNGPVFLPFLPLFFPYNLPIGTHDAAVVDLQAMGDIGLGSIAGMSDQLGGPVGADSYKRAVYHPPPSRFYVDMLPPLKQGGSYSYGFRITPANTDDCEGSVSSYSTRSTYRDVVYDVWRRWEDCLWFQETLEQTYSRLARDKHRRLIAGKGVKKNGMYLQDQASSWESLPPGPDPTSIAKDIHEFIPRLTKKGTLFRASQATIDQRYKELTALIEALFDFDVPALIKELRADREITDFFGYWRKDYDFFRKQEARLDKAPSPSDPRASMDSVAYTLAPPSTVAPSLRTMSDAASFAPSRGRGLSSPAPPSPTARSFSTFRKSHSRARSTTSSGSSSSQDSKNSDVSTPSTTAADSISVYDSDRRSQYLSDYSFGGDPATSLTTLREDKVYNSMSDRYSQSLSNPEKITPADRRSRRTVTIYSPSPSGSPGRGDYIGHAGIRESWQTTGTISGILDGLDVTLPDEDEYDSPSSPSPNRRNSGSSIETFMTSKTATAQNILSGLKSAFHLSPSRHGSDKANRSRESVATFMTTDSANAIIPRESAIQLLGRRPERDSIATIATFRTTDSADAIIPRQGRGVNTTRSVYEQRPRSARMSTMSTASEGDDFLSQYLDQFPVTLGSYSETAESRPSTPLGRLSMLPLAKSQSENSQTTPAVPSLSLTQPHGPTSTIFTGRARAASTSASIISSSTSSSSSSGGASGPNRLYLSIKAAFGNSIILLRVPKGIAFEELRDKVRQKFSQQEKIDLSDDFIIGFVPKATPSSPLASTSPSPQVTQQPVQSAMKGGRARSASLSSQQTMSSVSTVTGATASNATAAVKRGPMELVTSQREWEYVTVIAAGEKLMLKIFDCQATS